MPTFALIAVLPLLQLAPAATDRGAASVEVGASVEAAPAEPAPPLPTPVAGPTPQPMPVPVQPPPPPSANPFEPTVAGPPPVSDPEPPPQKRAREKTYPDRPIKWRVDIAGHLGNNVFGDTAWRAFDDDRKAFHLGATIRGDFRLGDGRVFLGGGLSFQRFASYGNLFGVLSNDIRVREPTAFLRLSVVTLEGVDVFVQAGGGPSLAVLDLYSTQSAYQYSVGAVVDGLGGLALYLPKKWLPRRGASRVTGGLELGFGYSWRSKLGVRPTVTVEDDPINTAAANFGDLSLRGFAWRFGLFVRFQ
jgi:hypothetical protein